MILILGMEKCILGMYTIYNEIKSWYYTADEINYYMLAEDGEQLPLYEIPCKPIWGFLTVHNKNFEYKYKFTSHFVIEDIEIPDYKWYGLQITIYEKQYNLEIDEFLVVNTILFTDMFKLWICRKLGVVPTTDVFISIIDENINVIPTNSLVLHKNNYIRAEQT